MILEGKGSNKLTTGCHLVTIKDIKMATRNGNPITSKSGGVAINLTLTSSSGKSITDMLWATPKTTWIWEKLYKSIGLNYSEKVDADEVIGKQLFVIIATEYCMPMRSFLGYRITTWFYPYQGDPVPPQIEGDPTRFGGEPSGKFVIETEESKVYRK